MATANIFGFPNAKAHSPRNAFDMSFDTLFGSPAGMLLPCYVEDVKAGDKLKLSCKNLTRTMAVNTAAYMSFSEKVDFFFVPYRLLWSAYPQWRLGTTQPRSTTALTNIGRLSSMPHASFSDITNFLRVNSYAKGLFNVGYFSTMCRYLDLLGYGLLPVKGITSYNTIGYYVADQVNTALTPTMQTIQRHFGGLASNHYFNYMRLAAFQCIYMYRYRNPDYEPLDPSFYNCDSLFISKEGTLQDGYITPPTSSSDYYDAVSTPYYLAFGDPLNESETPSDKKPTNRLDFSKLFTPRFKNWRHDLFTTLKPSAGILPAYGGGSSYDSTDVVIPPINGSLNDATESNSQGYVPAINANTSSRITMKDIRQLSALDKFSRLAIYADKNYSSLYEAIFGVKVDEPDVPRYLGTFSSDIKISEVVGTSAGTATTDKGTFTSSLGELAGKGLGTGQSQVFDDSFKEDGIVMGVHYIMPFNYYNPYRVNPFCLKSSKFDYYYPSFDGLGLSPVFLAERGYWSGVVADNGQSQLPTLYSSLLGFNTRYHEYKQRTNEVHGTFARGQSEEFWTMTINDIAYLDGIRNYKIDPRCTNPIFGIEFDGSMDTDPFKCFFSFNVTKVSDMEAIGIPNT